MCTSPSGGPSTSAPVRLADGRSRPPAARSAGGATRSALTARTPKAQWASTARGQTADRTSCEARFRTATPSWTARPRSHGCRADPQQPSDRLIAAYRVRNRRWPWGERPDRGGGRDGRRGRKCCRSLRHCSLTRRDTLAVGSSKARMDANHVELDQERVALSRSCAGRPTKRPASARDTSRSNFGESRFVISPRSVAMVPT